MLEPEFDLLGGDVLELRLELRELFRGRVGIIFEGTLQHDELLLGAATAVILRLELAEFGETLAAVLEPLGDLGAGDAELGGEQRFLVGARVRVLGKGLEEALLLGGGDAPLVRDGMRGVQLVLRKVWMRVMQRVRVAKVRMSGQGLLGVRIVRMVVIGHYKA